MTLIDEWKWVMRKALSFRFAVIAGVFSGAEVVLPLFVDALPRGIFAGLSVFAAIGSAVSRVVDQPKMERRSKPRSKPDAAKGDFND